MIELARKFCDYFKVAIKEIIEEIIKEIEADSKKTKWDDDDDGFFPAP